MNRIRTTFNKLQEKKRKALVIFLTVGDPSITGSANLVKAACEAGADIIELGVPFSDPLADGPVIQHSFTRAIAKGATLNKSMEMVEHLRTSLDTPLIYMISSMLVLNMGVQVFMRRSASVGVDGVIIPDMPLEEASEFVPYAKSTGMNSILLATPTTTSTRLRSIVSTSSGFVYYVNVSGVTGGILAKPAEVSRSVAKIKRITKLPVLAGFGIKDPKQARVLSKVCDGVIIGSKAIEVANAASNNKNGIKALDKFIRSVRKEMDRN
ncbi:MAG: tryptophan synthase subunit alpha [Anaerolineales bacterium]|jgi:tryptophan synthase alpha chain|nr:tryptophan synthase subunit alpha [Anaerolineales bacterium]